MVFSNGIQMIQKRKEGKKMPYIHIIVLFELLLLLITLYFIMKIHMKNSRVSKEKDFIDRYLESREKLIEKSGIHFPLKSYLLILVLAPLVIGIMVYMVTGSAVFSVLAGSFGLFTPRGIILLITHDNQKNFEERYARSLRQLSASLESGSSILNAVTEVSNCVFLHESIRRKYATLSSDLMMGISVAEAFKRFADGTNSKDAEDVALAIDVQNAVGGHEADVIREISNNIYSRIMLRREVNNIFMDTSIMVWMFDFLSPVVMIGFSLLNYQFVEVYFSSPIHMMIFATLLFVPLIGSFLNHKTIRKIKKGA